jgi:two-component system, NarL family, sensor histidine kinase DesK
MPARRVVTPDWLWPGWAAPGARPTADQATDARPAAGITAGGPRLARAILKAVLCGFLAMTVIGTLMSPADSPRVDLVVSLVSIALLFALQMHNCSAAAVQWTSRRRRLMLMTQALVTYLPLVMVGKAWAGGMPGFLAGSALLLLSGWRAWALFAAVVASALAVPLILGLGSHYAAYLVILAFNTGLAIFALTWFARIPRCDPAVHCRPGQLAVVRERMRFARDLHDLLGYSLCSITLKAELARRVLADQPGQASAEITDVIDTARQALADVRLLSSSYRSFSLAKEASSVASLLSARGIEARVELRCGPLDETVDTVLATVLREAVTNALRHSSARTCSVEACQRGETVRLRVANDGVQRAAVGGAGRNGCGLDNMAARLEAIGGRLTAGVTNHGWFSVLAEAPGTADHAAGQRTTHAAWARGGQHEDAV